MIICAGESEQIGDAIPIGIGMVDAAIRLTELCLKDKPNELIFVGTAGSYGYAKLFDVMESSSAVNIENSSLSGDSYTPIESIVSHETSKNTLIVNSSNYITTNADISKQYIDRGVDLENMEFYAVAKVAQRYSRPFRGVFCVTNYCDENAHSDFIKNRSKAMEILTKKVKEIEQ